MTVCALVFLCLSTIITANESPTPLRLLTAYDHITPNFPLTVYGSDLDKHIDFMKSKPCGICLFEHGVKSHWWRSQDGYFAHDTCYQRINPHELVLIHAIKRITKKRTHQDPHDAIIFENRAHTLCASAAQSIVQAHDHASLELFARQEHPEKVAALFKAIARAAEETDLQELEDKDFLIEQTWKHLSDF